MFECDVNPDFVRPFDWKAQCTQLCHWTIMEVPSNLHILIFDRLNLFEYIWNLTIL